MARPGLGPGKRVARYVLRSPFAPSVPRRGPSDTKNGYIQDHAGPTHVDHPLGIAAHAPGNPVAGVRPGGRG